MSRFAVMALFAASAAFADPVTITFADLRPSNGVECEQWFAFSQSSGICKGIPADIGYHRCGAQTKTIEGEVRIAGYPLPMEIEFKDVRRFMLTPAPVWCSHPPPPMPNQIIYIEANDGIDIGFDPVFVTGRIEPHLMMHGMAQIRYRMQDVSVESASPQSVSVE